MEQELYNKIFLDLLMDIRSSQMVIEKICLDLTSEKTETGYKENCDKFLHEKERAMEQIRDAVFAKYTGLHPELRLLLWP